MRCVEWERSPLHPNEGGTLQPDLILVALLESEQCLLLFYSGRTSKKHSKLLWD